jgi:glucosyl-dolichyl phosphate glucuronosyltransferase
MLLSIIICTYNRADLLRKTVLSILEQQFQYGDLEVLIIDNASTDHTKDVVAELRKNHSHIIYHLEPKLGVAIARNTGARLSRGRYIAYFDDDLILEKDCLNELIAPCFDVSPAPAVVTGRCLLDWEGGRAEWFPEKYESLLSRYDFGETPRFMKESEYLVTMNVAFDRDVFIALGGIREDLSRKGRMFICGGDNDIFHRFYSNGYKIYHNPKAIIYHWVPRSRQTIEWLDKRTFGQGSTNAIADFEKKRGIKVFRALFYHFRQLLKMLIKRRGINKYDHRFAIQAQKGKVYALFQMFLGRKNIKTATE